MGYGSYTAADWVKLKNSRGIDSTSSAKNIFICNEMNDKYNPKFINMRESVDSNDSPESTPIIIGFDVTGSMGYLAEEIAKNALNKTILNIYDKKPVTNPHIMCAAIGDVKDNAPLQVTQFEADIRIVEQLTELWLEMGGFDFAESYNLLWYFAAKHTKTDAFEKRGKKGFLFTIGDATVHPTIEAECFQRIFDVNEKTFTNSALIAEASKKYEIFHIVTKNASSYDKWKLTLPGRVTYISDNNIQYLSEVITSIMQLSTGVSKKDVIAQWPEEAQLTVKEAIKDIQPSVADIKFPETGKMPSFKERKLTDIAKKLFNK